MIPLIEELEEYYKEFRFYENCYFKCGNTTKFWYWRTNQPICKKCAKTRKVSEVNKCTKDYKVPTKEEYLKKTLVVVNDLYMKSKATKIAYKGE